jgi:leucyl-tRNA synthetase
LPENPWCCRSLKTPGVNAAQFDKQSGNLAMKHFNSVHLSPWPKYDPKLIVEETVTIPVQVNGKLRSTLTVDRLQTTEKTKIIALAKGDQKVSKWLEGKEIKKEIYIEGKLVNFVI